jgi:hypothetical protein
VAEPGNPADLADKIRSFHGDRDLTSRCGTNARSASLLFDRKGQVARYMSVFKDVLRESRS